MQPDLPLNADYRSFFSAVRVGRPPVEPVYGLQHKHAPHYRIYAILPNLWAAGQDIMYGSPNPPASTATEYAAKLRNNLESAYELVREKMGHSLRRQKDIYDQRAHSKPFMIGDLV